MPVCTLAKFWTSLVGPLCPSCHLCPSYHRPLNPSHRGAGIHWQLRTSDVVFEVSKSYTMWSHICKYTFCRQFPGTKGWITCQHLWPLWCCPDTVIKYLNAELRTRSNMLSFHGFFSWPLSSVWYSITTNPNCQSLRLRDRSQRQWQRCKTVFNEVPA